MNTFAGNITCAKKIPDTDQYDFDIVDGGNNTYFVMGEIDIDSSEELLKYFGTLVGDITSFDLSITSEDRLEIWNDGYEDGVYEVVAFEGSDVNFDLISERFDEVEEVIAVREAEDSNKFGNKIIKVDFLY